MSQYLERIMLITFVCAIVVTALVSCGPGGSSFITVQPPAPTPTLEPTFTPSPASTRDPQRVPPTPQTDLTPATAPEQATLFGRILDQSTNQPIAGAQVSAGTANTTTDTDGRYTLTGLPSGQYVLSVTHPDYDPGLSSILTVAAGEELVTDLPLYEPNTSPYPEDPMLTNPLDPNGAPTAEDAERLARLQGFIGEVVSIRETKLGGEFLVNYKIGDDVRAAVALVRHEVWELIDEAGRQWWIIKVCGNLASRLPEQSPIPTPAPKLLPPLAEVLVDGLVVRECAAEDCGEVGSVPGGERVEVFGCLAHETGGWCEVGWSGVRGWCTGQSLRQLAVATVIPEVEMVLPTATPSAVAEGEGKIVFSREDPFTDDDIYVINPDGTGLTQLTSDSSQDWQPAWLPDRQRIAFSRNGIYVMNADGGSQTRLTNPPQYDGEPRWSPDGQHIVFESGVGSPSIYLMNANGSGLTRLTNGSFPDWSPDGTRIVFSGNGIQTINVNGSGLINLADEGSFPKWSPNGQQIVFTSFRDGNGEIYLINADGSDLKRLTNRPDSDVRPSWSPDGSQIVFASSQEQFLYIINADGSGLTPLTNGYYPDW